MCNQPTVDVGCPHAALDDLGARYPVQQAGSLRAAIPGPAAAAFAGLILFRGVDAKYPDAPTRNL